VDQIEEIKAKTDIVSLIGEYTQLKKAGRNYKALCPFHGEKTPSFMVSPELQIFKCFGCQASGDAFAFLQQYEGMDFGEALKLLAEKSGVKLVPLRRGDFSEKERLYSINSLAEKFYQYFLLSHPVGKSALNYLLQERDLKLATIKEFRLGFSPDNPIALKRFLVDKKRFTPREIEGAGIGYPKGGYFVDRFRGRIIFPLFDHRGNTVGFAGRLLPGPKEKELAKYINTPETPVYHKGNLLYGLNLTRQNIKRKETAIVVEGELDAISSWQIGVKNVVAIKGSALTEDQVRLLYRFSKKLVLCLDADIAGDAAARRGVVIAQNQGLEVKVAQLTKFKDPDEAARGDAEGYKKALIKAVGVWDFLVESAFSRFDTRTGEGNAKVSREIVPILSSIADKIVQAHYIKTVARRLGVPEEAVSQQIEKEAQKEEIKIAPEAVGKVKEEKNRRALLEERLLSLGFRFDPKLLKDKKILPLFETPLAKRILAEYFTFSKKHKIFNASEFSRKLPKELFEGFAQMVLTEEELDNESEAQTEFLIVKHELKVFSVKKELSEMTAEIRALEEKDEKSKIIKLEKKFNELTQKLYQLEQEVRSGIMLKEE